MLTHRFFPKMAALGLASLLAPAAVHATDFYLGSSAGGQGGTAIADIAALNALRLQPGDQIAFQGGETFCGTLEFTAEDRGTATQPIRVTSFGTGRATISSGTAAGIKIYNTGGIAVSALNLVGSGKSSNQCRGIDAGVYLPDSTKFDYLRFEQMKISGYYTGVEIWAWYSTSTVAWPGFRDVTLSGLEVFDNCSEGIKTWGTWRANTTGTKFSHSDFYVADCLVYGNQGDPAATWHTGSGIILSGVDRGTIEYCVAHDNGGFGPTTGGGPFGIWIWESRACTLQHNLVYNQKTPSSLDGGAYDLDGGSSDSVVQYNYSYNNHGPAIGIIQFRDASPLTRNVVRYNISENDCRKTGQGILYVGQFSGTYGINTADIYGNTFFVSTTPTGGKPAAANVADNSLVANVRIRNNLFVASHAGALIGGIKTNPAKALYQGNNYWGGSFDLAAFRANGQEMLAGQAVGSRLDPLLTAPGQGGVITDSLNLENITAYRLRADSPVATTGLDLTTLFGIAVGGRDFYGTAEDSSALSIGAAAGTAPAPAPALSVVDEFTGTGGLNDRAPDTAASSGQRWIVQTGSASISNGDAVAANTLRAVIDGGSADGIVESTIVYGAVDTGIVLRSSNSSNYLRAKLTTGALNLARIEAGAATTVGVAKLNFVLGQTYRLKAVLAGPSITVLVDDVVVLTASTSFNQTAQLFGLFSANTGTRRWSRFEFSGSTTTSPAEPEAPATAPVVITEPAAGSGTVIVADDFSGAGSLSNRLPDTIAPDGTAWNVLVGSFSAAAGSASAANSARAVIDVGVADGVLESAVNFGANDTGLVVRCVDAANYLRVVLTTSGLTVRSYQAGVGSNLCVVKSAYAIGQTYRLKVVLAGPSIEVFVNDAPVASLSSALNQNATRFGLFAANTGSRQWQNFTFSSR